MAVDRVFMEQAYQYFVKYFKKTKDVDYDLLLSILLYLVKDELVIETYYKPMFYYNNREIVDRSIERILKDFKISKEEFLRKYQDDAEEYDDIIGDVFDQSLDFIYDIVVDPSSDELSYYEEYFEKIKLHKANIGKYSN